MGDQSRLITRFESFGRRFAAPSPMVTDDEDRRRASLLGNVSLFLTVVLAFSALVSAFTTIVFPDPDVSLGWAGTVVIALTALCFFGALRLGRRPHFEYGAWLTIATIDAFLFGLGLLYPEYGASLALGFAVPVICSTILLDAAGTFVVFVSSAVIGTAHLILSDLTLVDMAFVMGIMLAVTGLAVVIAVLREADLAKVVKLRELELADAERLRGELELARRVQLAMLPDRLPSSDRIDLAVYSEPAYEASGDFYDVFELDPKAGSAVPQIALVVCDVAGKGVAAALVMSATRAALRAEAQRSPSPADVLASVNRTLAASLPPGLFVTLCYAVFDPPTSTLTYASAGHPHPLHWIAAERRVLELESYGMPLGLVDSSTYESSETVLRGGDAVVVFTDGLVEALDGEREMYGFDRSLADFTALAGVGGSAEQRLHGVIGAMRAFIGDERLHDDVTIVTMVVPTAAVPTGSAELEEQAWIAARSSAHLPIDRLAAVVAGEQLPMHCSGAVVFADIAGFTPLTDALARLLGPRLGAEQLTRHLNQVYDVVINEVHRFGGTVVDFSGDAVTCWFDDLRPSGSTTGLLRALTAALRLEREVARIGALILPDGTSVRLSLKVAVAAGPAWRHAVGDPSQRRVDVLAGETVGRTAAAERVAAAGEVVVDLGSSAAPPGLALGERRRTEDGSDVAVVVDLDPPAGECRWPIVGDSALQLDLIRPWIDHLSGDRPHELVTELRPTVALFVRFDGIDTDDPSCADALDSYVRWVQAVIGRHDGTLIQVTVGDKGSYLYIAFGAPVAHEDLADRAVACALDLRDAPVFGALHQLAMGLDQGVARTGAYGGHERRTYGVLGEGTNVAARLMMLGAPGEILITSRVRNACRRRIVVEVVGERTLKGQVTPVEIARVIDRPMLGTDGIEYGRLVGRPNELRRLTGLLGDALGGAGRTIEVVGEAGVGKSHLIDAARREIAGDGIAWLTAASEERAGSSLHAFVPLLRGAFFQELAATAEDGKQLLELGVEELCAVLAASEEDVAHDLAAELAVASSALGAVLGLRWEDSPYERQDPAGRLERSLRAVVAYLTAESHRRPLVLHLRDAHWLDADSLRLVELLAVEADRHRLCLLFDRRPMVSVAARSVVVLPEVDDRRIELGPLDCGGVAELAAVVLGGPADEALVARLFERTGGTPMFVEQLVLHLIDRELVRLGEDGHWHQAVSGGGWDVSVSLSAVLVARLDRLADDVRQVVQAAAVLGDAFATPVLVDLLRSEVADDTVTEAIGAGAIASVWSMVDGGTTVVFRHALVREAAYEMQLDQRRRELHRRAAGSVRRHGGRHGVRQAATLAHHDVRSGRHSRAAAHLRRGGDAAVADSRYREALTMYEQALELTGSALGANAAQVAQVALHDRIADAARAVGDYERAVEHYRRAIESTGRASVSLVGRWTRLGETLERAGCDDEAESAFESALEALQAAPELSLASRIYTGLAALHGRRGELDAAVELGELALGFAGGAADAARAHQCLCVIEGGRQRTAAAVGHGRKSVELWNTVGDLQGRGAARNNLGLALAAHGDERSALAELRGAVEDFEAAGNEHGLACALDNLADLLVRSGQEDDGMACLERAVEILARIGIGNSGVIAAMWRAGSW